MYGQFEILTTWLTLSKFSLWDLRFL